APRHNAFPAGSRPGWDTVRGTGWRRRDRIARPFEVIAIADALSGLILGDRHEREAVGQAWEIIPGTVADNQGSHVKLGRWPAVYLDGHALALRRAPEAWEGRQPDYTRP